MKKTRGRMILTTALSALLLVSIPLHILAENVETACTDENTPSSEESVGTLTPEETEAETFAEETIPQTEIETAEAVTEEPEGEEREPVSEDTETASEAETEIETETEMETEEMESESEEMTEKLADAVAQIGEEKYASLKEAVEAASSGDTIELLKTVESDGNITITGKTLTITGNALERAAGDTAVHLITIAGGAALTLRDITVDGKELSAQEPLIRVEAGGALTLESGAVLQSSKVGSWKSGGATWGGAVLTYGTLTMNGDSCIQNNSASYGGGVVVWGEGQLIMNDTSSIRNNKGYRGGGVRSYMDSDSEMSAYYNGSSAGGTIVLNGNASLSGNYATLEGGAIDHQVGMLTMNASSSITGNSTGNMGGGVHNENLGKFIMNDNSSVTNNSAVGVGGGISNVGGGGAPIGFPELTLDEARSGYLIMNGNSVVSNNTAASGGGVYNHNVTSQYEGTFSAVMTMNDNSSVTENEATRYGGGIWVGARLTMNGSSTVANNTSGMGGGGVNGDNMARNSVFYFNSGEIYNNQSASGGGVYFLGGTIYMKNGSVHNNTGTSGGGIYLWGASLMMENGVIHHNSATGMGGGIYVYNGSVLMNGGSVTENMSNNGGGIANRVRSTVEMKGGSITRNVSNTEGGGVYNYAAAFTMEDGELYNNHALNLGDDVCSRTLLSDSYTTSLTLPDISQKGWMLDGDHEDPEITECEHAINGWYYDGVGGEEETSALRWNVVNAATGESCNEKNEDNAEHWEEYTTFTTYEGEVALKATHDRLVPYKVAHRYTYRKYDVDGTLLTEDVQTVTEETIRYGVRGTTIPADGMERKPEYEGKTYGNDGNSDPILLEMEDTVDTAKTITLYYLLEERPQPEETEPPTESETPKITEPPTESETPKITETETPETETPETETPKITETETSKITETKKETETTKNDHNSPKTGDETPITLWNILLVVSMLGIGMGLLRNKPGKKTS